MEGNSREQCLVWLFFSWFNGSRWHVYLWCNLCSYVLYSELCSRGSPAWTHRSPIHHDGEWNRLDPWPLRFWLKWRPCRRILRPLPHGAPPRPGSAPVEKSIHYIFPPDLRSDPDCRSPVRPQLVWTAGPANKTSLHWRGKGASALTLSELFTLALVIIMHYMKGRIPFIIDHCVSSALELLPL